MRVAVVGGGIFGCTAAIHAARDGHRVDLYEASHGLMRAASGINQYRLHQGYHYPRSPETGEECRAGLVSFRAEYGPAVIDDDRHVYAIAKDGSKTDAAAYLKFCQDAGLPFRTVRFGLCDPATVEIAIEAAEARYDPDVLRDMVTAGLNAAGVSVYCGTRITRAIADEYDAVVIAAYAGTNEVARELDCPEEVYQYEVCEKPVVRMPDTFGETSLVVMDGEFCSIDPFSQTGLFVLGHVKHAIWSRNVGTEPVISERLKAYLNSGVVLDAKYTMADEFIRDGGRYVPMLKRAEHVGSMYTVRAVLPNVDATDERPTLVSALSDRVLRVFSGKVPTAVTAARSVVTSLERMGGRVRSAA